MDIALSATQISDYRLCKRRWGWAKLDGIKGPPNKFAERGTRIHSILEEWLGQGKPIDVTTEEGMIAAAGVQHLPPPSKDLLLEEWIVLHTDVAKYQGKVDLGYVNPKTGRWVVHDHKTTTDLGWAKTEEDLRKDPQALIYAAERMARNGVDEVELSWLYMRTKGKPKSHLVRLTVVRDEVEAGLEEIDATAKEMVAAHQAGLKALDLPPDPRACMAYGGCPYVGNCNLTTIEKMKALMAQELTALEKLKAKQQGANGTPAPAPAPAPAAAAPAPAAAKAKPAPAINPPEAKTAPHAAPAASLDLSPLVKAIQELAAKHAPRDLRDEIALAVIQGAGGNLDVIGSAYDVADEVLKARGGK